MPEPSAEKKTADMTAGGPSTGSAGSRGPVTPEWEAPPGASAPMTWAPDGHEPVSLTATADWTVLRREESPAAEVFAVSYLATDADPDRPVTFVFNGGPGASSAYLHVGAIGPRRVVLPDDGSSARMPVRLVDNDSSWIADTDLVFIDPVGTGFSRPIPSEPKPGEHPPNYWSYDRDLTAMREFISRWLSRNRRWAAPVFIAGESYGGYRVGRLAWSLPKDEGVGLAGAVLISPALEITPLTFTDYATDPYVDTVPTMAAGAFHHGRCRAPEAADGVDAVAEAAASFATTDYATFLMRGAAVPAEERAAVLSRLADLIGLAPTVVEHLQGRIGIDRWVREILRDRGEVAGLYDVTQTVVDPFPDRVSFEGGDHTLAGSTAAFTMAINHLLRAEIGVETERQYSLLSYEVNEKWVADDDHHALEAPPGSVDDLRRGLTLNPHLGALIVHGRHDLVTPLDSSRRIIDLMRLAPTTGDRVRLRAYDGGHMFYTLSDSRDAFTADVREFFTACLPGRATG
ncbi:S10 family peptidase [Agromyces sp. SYSU T0242]|uniref:S10 family peptidase n=1 Tax=Agromyces litoreus TaxID=3158561 RepID=UPI003391D4BE